MRRISSSGVDVVGDLERRRLGRREDRAAASTSTSISPVGELGVAGCPPRARTTSPATPMQNSRAQLVARARAPRALTSRVEHDLREAVAIAQIDEDAAAVIAAGWHPAEEDDALADVAGAQLRRSRGSASCFARNALMGNGL